MVLCTEKDEVSSPRTFPSVLQGIVYISELAIPMMGLQNLSELNRYELELDDQLSP